MTQMNGYRLGSICMIAAIIACTASAYHRNSVWITKLALWKDVVSKTPYKSRVHNSLGNCYMLIGDHYKAVEEYRTALALDKNNAEVYYNIAINLEKIGLEYEAYEYYQQFCRLNVPDLQEATRVSCLRAMQLSSELNLSAR